MQWFLRPRTLQVHLLHCRQSVPSGRGTAGHSIILLNIWAGAAARSEPPLGLQSGLGLGLGLVMWMGMSMGTLGAPTTIPSPDYHLGVAAATAADETSRSTWDTNTLSRNRGPEQMNAKVRDFASGRAHRQWMQRIEKVRRPREHMEPTVGSALAPRASLAVSPEEAETEAPCEDPP